MIYFFETELFDNKYVYSSLSKVFGINIQTSQRICNHLGISKNCKIKDLTKDQLNSISIVLKSFKVLVGQDLKKNLILGKKLDIKLKSYKSYRILSNLPLRGQRTHTNAKNCKKKKF